MADLKEEITTLKCGPCFFDGDSVEPKHFCVDCLEYLCTGCAREHRRYKLSREHTVLEDSEFPPDAKLFEEMKKLSYCHKHLNIEVDKYCPNHDELICMYCLQTDHMSCEGLSDLTDLIEDFMRIKPEERFHDLQIKCKEKQNEIMPHLDEALVDINKVNKEIHVFIHILKENVDQIEKKLNQKLKTSTQRVRQFEEKLSKLETKTSFYENLHIITSKYGTEKHRIVFNFTLCALRKELEADDSLKSVIKEKIQFKQPTKVEDLMAMLRQFDVVPLCKDEQASDEFSSDEESLYEDAMEFLEPKTRDEATQYEVILAECGNTLERALSCLKVIHNSIRLLKFEYQKSEEIKRSVVAADILSDGRILLLQQEKIVSLHSPKLQLLSKFDLELNAKDMCVVEQTRKCNFTIAVCFEQSSKILILEYHDRFREQIRKQGINCSHNVVSISMYSHHLVALVERKSSKSSYEIQLLDVPTGHVCYAFDEFKQATSVHASYNACVTICKPNRIRTCKKTNHVVLADANTVYRFSIEDGKCENDTVYAVGQCVWQGHKIYNKYSGHYDDPTLNNATDVKCDFQGNMYVQTKSALYQVCQSKGCFIVRKLMEQFGNVAALAIGESSKCIVVGYINSDRAHVYTYSFPKDK